MSIEELVERSEIKFYVPLNKEEAEDLFDYIGKELPGEVSYTVAESKRIGYMFEEVNQNHEFPWKETNGLSISGKIFSRKGGASSFDTTTTLETPTLIHGISFQTILGYKVEKHAPKEVQLWDDVRNAVEAYFKTHFLEGTVMSITPDKTQTPQETGKSISTNAYSGSLGSGKYEQIAEKIINASKIAGKWTVLPSSQLIWPDAVEEMLAEGFLLKSLNGYMLSEKALMQIAEKYKAKKE